MIERPSEKEYPEFYATYIDKVPKGDILKYLRKQKADFKKFIEDIPEERLSYRYKEDKWTIKQILGHINDTERIMTYRALAFSRGERQLIPGFNENEYVANGAFNRRKTGDLLREFVKLRENSLLLIDSFNEAMIDKKGNANELLMSVRAIVYIIAGHLEHHKGVIETKYLQTK